MTQSFKMAVGSGTCITSSGPTQDLTITNFGTVKAVLITVTAGVTDGSIADHAVLSFGMSDGTESYALGFVADDNSANANTRDGTSDGNVIFIGSTGADTIDAEATVSFITDGVRLSWSDFPASAHLINFTLFGGDDSDFQCDSVAAPSTLNGTIETTTGFETEMLIGGSRTPSTGGAENFASNARLSLGLATYDGTTFSQASHARWSIDGLGTANEGSRCRDDMFMQTITNSGPTIVDRSAVEWTARSSTTYTLTTREAASNCNMIVLAISTNGKRRSKVCAAQTVTVTGNAPYEDFEFPVQHVIGILTGNDDFTDIAQNTVDSETQGLAMFNRDAEYCAAITSERSVTITNTASVTENIALRALAGDQSDLYVATWDGTTEDGFDLNYSTVNATKRKVLFLGIEQDPGSSPLTAFLSNRAKHDRLRRM